MKYPGQELENFDNASVWNKYIYSLLKKYLRNNMLEVGAGIGSFTKNYEKKFSEIMITEADQENLSRLKNKFSNNNNISISNSLVKDINKKFDSIIYLNVLEHIENDIDEINSALDKINSNGYLVLLVPAHSKLYGKFDKAIGHYRRYEINFFTKVKFNNSKLIDLCYLDCFGYFLYRANQMIFKKETYPSKIKIFIWDKLFVPLTVLFDFAFRYKFGKNIMCIMQKK